MLVHPSQLVPGCLVVSDVMGKTNRPIIPKNTALDEQTIQFLRKFLVEKVEVSSRLSYGAPFIPKEVLPEDSDKKETEKAVQPEEPKTFEDLYFQSVREFKKLFEGWQSSQSIDINKLRKFVLPLFEKIDDVGDQLYKIHQYSNKQDYFYHHAVATGILSAYLSRQMGYQKEWIQIGIAGFLADCGMARIDEDLIGKQGTFTDRDLKEMQNHPTFSYRLVEKIASLSMGVKLAVLQHHERLDGSGYPLKVDKSKIHPYATIIAVCDMYHAMTSERVHQPKQSPFLVIERMHREQFGKLDHEALRALMKCLTSFSIGTKVRLSNQQIGEIVFLEESTPTRPMVRVNGEIITLKKDLNLYMEEILT
ncbi:HD-GYP domain-containing protein [Radiobacillus kanasensis]|uniref:HD-GYP domain-containing protein n=1 Tax=Radiobacillus kanasensis TaxID=2844358 RepID=UPI001E4BCCDD|nr:HD-GYP domain-containing protein [Radiobacillus kanasensis]UFT99434.1 HD-GYP domain-containing protein [Radiobacillus kanasensis]